MSAPAQAPGRSRGPGAGQTGGADGAQRPNRPLAVTGGMAASAVAGTGLAALTTLTAVGWITAPHAAGLGSGLPGVLRTAATIWLAAHHVAFTLRGVGPIGMLPLGLVLLPGALLWRAGRWVVKTGEVARLRHVGYAALALAVPYALLCGALALASRSALAAPSLSQAVVEPFLAALVAGGLGGAHALAPWRRLAGLLPMRSRSVIMGTLATLGLLTAAAALLAGGSFAAHLGQVRALTDSLSPGPVGSALLLLAEIGYVPNAVVWAAAYTLGPGFAFGAGTVVAPTGSVLGAMPAFPMLAALPSGPRDGVPAWLALAVLATPYLAAAAGGILTVRIMPTPMLEAAPLWGFASGACAGCVVGVLAAFAGGPLGSGRLAAVGPSGWQVGLVAVLEMGVTGAVTAGAANWLMLRRSAAGPASVIAPAGEDAVDADDPGDYRVAGPVVPAGQVDEADDAGGHRIYLDPWADDRPAE